MSDETASPVLDPARRARAESALAALVENGDLDRLVALARVAGAVTDMLSDDIVVRLAGVAAGGLDLLDRANRSNIAGTLPALAALVENGDLERLVALGRLVGAAADMLSDDIVARLAATAGNALVLLDRITRNGLAERLLGLAEAAERSGVMADLGAALDAAAGEMREAAPPSGGVGGLWRLLRAPGTQAAAGYAVAVLRHFRAAREGRDA